MNNSRAPQAITFSHVASFVPPTASLTAPLSIGETKSPQEATAWEADRICYFLFEINETSTEARLERMKEIAKRKAASKQIKTERDHQERETKRRSAVQSQTMTDFFSRKRKPRSTRQAPSFFLGNNKSFNFR